MTRYTCPVCGSEMAEPVNFEARREAALHRKEHERQDRRRATWRAYARRRYAKVKNPDYIGALHSLSCRGEHRGKRFGCIPIPVYDHPVTP